MIPRHISRVRILDILLSNIPNSRKSTEELEIDLAADFRTKYAILLPSARAGIQWAITDDSKIDLVFCPVFTCGVVHEAVLRSGKKPHYVDCMANDILAEKRILDAAGPSHAVIYSEVYGRSYEAYSNHARLSIIDRAMSMPPLDRKVPLQENAIEFYSFGKGKPVSIGFGGFALTNNLMLIEKLRYAREHNSIASKRLLGMKNFITLKLGMKRAVYKYARLFLDQRASRQRVADKSAASEDGWYTMPPIWALRGACRLVCSPGYQYTNYEVVLKYKEGIEKNELSQAAFAITASHFAILHRNRDNIREALWREGIDTATYFGFPTNLDPSEYPNSKIASERILGLPISSVKNRIEQGFIIDIYNNINVKTAKSKN